MAAAPPVKKRAVRKDKGLLRGPRPLRGAATYRVGNLNLHRFRFGIERQVSQATRDAVAEGQRLGVKPWLVASWQELAARPVRRAYSTRRPRAPTGATTRGG